MNLVFKSTSLPVDRPVAGTISRSPEKKPANAGWENDVSYNQQKPLIRTCVSKLRCLQTNVFFFFRKEKDQLTLVVFFGWGSKCLSFESLS